MEDVCLVPRPADFEGQGQFWWSACGLCLEKHLCSSLLLLLERPQSRRTDPLLIYSFQFRSAFLY